LKSRRFSKLVVYDFTIFIVIVGTKRANEHRTINRSSVNVHEKKEEGKGKERRKEKKKSFEGKENGA